MKGRLTILLMSGTNMTLFCEKCHPLKRQGVKHGRLFKFKFSKKVFNTEAQFPESVNTQ